jgi:hypothetical protein
VGLSRQTPETAAFQGERLKTTTGHGLRPAEKSRRRQVPSAVSTGEPLW